jgi:hypothetical protein
MQAVSASATLAVTTDEIQECWRTRVESATEGDIEGDIEDNTEDNIDDPFRGSAPPHRRSASRASSVGASSTPFAARCLHLAPTSAVDRDRSRRGYAATRDAGVQTVRITTATSSR